MNVNLGIKSESVKKLSDHIGAKARIINSESDALSSSGALNTNFSPGTTVPPLTDGVSGATISTIGFNVYPGFIVNLKGIVISADGPCIAYLTVKNHGIGTSSALNKVTQTGPVASFGANGGSQFISFGDGIDLYEGGGYNIGFYRLTVKTPIVAHFPVGQMYTQDPNYNAKFVYMPIGDSISWGTLGNLNANSSTPNKGKTHYAKRITKMLRDSGIDTRVSMRGLGQSRIDHWVEVADIGRIAEMRPHLVTLGVGTNDAPTGTAEATGFRDKVKYVMNYIFTELSDPKINPDISIILLGAPQTDDTSILPNIQGYRDAMASIVSTKGDGDFASKDIFYYDQSVDLPVATAANFVETVAGTKIHPRGDTGHAIIANGLWSIVQQTKFYLDNQ
jgi:hypothetical protein